jgi:hypothetical protein
MERRAVSKADKLRAPEDENARLEFRSGQTR